MSPRQWGGVQGTNRTGFLNLLTVDTWGWPCGEDVEQHPWPYLPKMYNQKCLQTLPSGPWPRTPGLENYLGHEAWC